MKHYILGATLLALFANVTQAFTHVTTNITDPLTKWTKAAGPYILQGPIYIKEATPGAGAILDIEAGTVIRGQPATSPSTFDPGSLIITPTGKIQARGASNEPVIFTTAALDAGLAAGGSATGVALDANSDGKADRWTSTDGDSKYLDLNPKTSPLPPLNPNGLKNANYWGGLVIAGDSLTNSGNQVSNGSGGFLDGKGIIEGLSGTDAIYGGTNTEHNGGILKYVSIRHGGDNLVAGKELNGLTLYAVGAKTTISYIDVYSTGDDGVEIFGGTVNIDHLNINYADDDGLDLDEGYAGTIQYVFVLQGQGYGDNGFELDGEDKLELNTISSTGLPLGDARIYNATVLATTGTVAANMPNASASGASVNAARLRAGFVGQIVNSIFVNTNATANGNGLRIDGLKTTGLVTGEVAETEPSARTNFGTAKVQLRNNTVVGFTAASLYPNFTANGISIAGATGAITGSTPDPVVYPAAGLRTATPVIAAVSHNTANGVNPRPGLGANNAAYGTTQDPAYVVTPADILGYKGAFDRTASTLWTTGWTALNARGILKN